jgi:hypothetical protein
VPARPLHPTRPHQFRKQSNQHGLSLPSAAQERKKKGASTSARLTPCSALLPMLLFTPSSSGLKNRV